MTKQTSEFWKERLTIPAYRVGEAASYAKISPQTVTAWHKIKDRSKRRPLSTKPKGAGLSFLQLIELAVVSEMTRAGVKLAEVDRARKYFKETTGLEFPFAQLKFKTDGADILAEFEMPDGNRAKDKLVSANRSGQLIWTEMISRLLREFDYGPSGEVLRWKVAGEDKPVEIDPQISFGAPQIHGVRTAMIKSRWLGGEEVEDIADDFSIAELDVIEALVFEGISADNERISAWIN